MISTIKEKSASEGEDPSSSEERKGNLKIPTPEKGVGKYREN